VALLVRRGWSDRRAVLAAAACVPVMSVVPGISHDYKLVLYVLPLAVLTAVVATGRGRGGIAWAAWFGVTAWVTLQLSRSALVMKPSLQNSKYLMIVLVQVLLLIAVVMTENGAVGEGPGDENDGVATPAAEEETT
jgi:hypothetical protein